MRIGNTEISNIKVGTTDVQRVYAGSSLIWERLSGEPETYYISSTGSDANLGTIDSPFQTVAKVNSLNLAAGSSVYFKGGETFVGNLIITDSGILDSPITVSSYGGSLATIDGGNNNGILVEGNYCNVNSINVIGNGRDTGNTGFGIYARNCSNVNINNVQASGFQKAGIATFKCHYVLIEDSIANNNGGIGIFPHGSYYGASADSMLAIADRDSSNVTIRRCSVYDNFGDPTITTNWTGSGILVEAVNNVIIENCIATNNGGISNPYTASGPGGIWMAHVDNGVIRKSLSYANNTSPGAPDGGGFDLDGGCTNCIVEQNVSYNNDGPGYLFVAYEEAGVTPWASNVLRYNISINDKQLLTNNADEGSGFNIYAGLNVSDSLVHNNIFYSDTKNPVSLQVSSKIINANFYNNMIVGSGELIKGTIDPTKHKFRHNLYYNAPGKTMTPIAGYATVLDWANATNQEMVDAVFVGVEADPMIVGPNFLTNITDVSSFNTLSQYHLQAGSPAINAGVDWATTGVVSNSDADFYGNVSPIEIRNIGVYEEPAYVYETETSAFISSVESGGDTLTSSQKIAVDELVRGLKGANLWTKMYAVWPFVGGTATSHKWNLKDPQDADTAYRLTFYNNPIHSADGVNFDAVSQYAETYLIASDAGMTPTSSHFSAYTPSSFIDTVFLGSYTDTNDTEMSLSMNDQNYFIAVFMNGFNHYPFKQILDTPGLYIGNKVSTSMTQGWHRGTKVVNSTQNFTNMITDTTFNLGALNYVGGKFFRGQPSTISFSSIGAGLTDAEALEFNNIVENYQTNLNRTV